MLARFRTYQLSLQFYREAKKVNAPQYLKNQLLRAASSVTLNLAEGSAKPTVADRKRFYSISLGSLRECQAVLELLDRENLQAMSDHLGACLYKLSR